MITEQLLERLNRLEAKVDLLLKGGKEQEWYTTTEFVEAVSRSEYSVREWCRLRGIL